MKLQTILERLKAGSRQSVKTEMLLLNQHLINESFGPDGIVTKEFDKLAKHYSPDNPIDEDSARELLVSLVKLAAAQRKKLAPQVIKRVETGAFFQPYHKRLHAINTLAIRADGCRRDAEFVREEYILEKALFWKNKKNSYAQDTNDPLTQEEMDEAAKSVDNMDTLHVGGAAQ